MHVVRTANGFGLEDLPSFHTGRAWAAHGAARTGPGVQRRAAQSLHNRQRRAAQHLDAGDDGCVARRLARVEDLSHGRVLEPLLAHKEEPIE